MTTETKQLDAVNQESANALYGEPVKEVKSDAIEKTVVTEETSTNEPAKAEVDEVEAKSQEDQGSQEGQTETKEEVVYKLELSKESRLDNSNVEEIISFAKENNLSNEQAQAILNKQESLISKIFEESQALQEKQISEWREAVINDKVMGGNNLKVTAENARKVVERFGTEEFISILRDTGYGDNPEVVRFLSKIGAIMGDDSLILPSARAESTKSIEELFYGSN